MHIILILLWCFFTEKMIKNVNTFRGFHCLCLCICSLYNLSVIDFATLYTQTVVSNVEIYLICNYLFIYLIYDLKNTLARYDLFIHHIVVILWVYINFSTTIASVCILNEVVTCSYLISNPKTQWLFRIIIVIFIRYPIWVLVYIATYNATHMSFYALLVSKIIIHIMLVLDLIWLRKYVKNYLISC